MNLMSLSALHLKILQQISFSIRVERGYHVVVTVRSREKISELPSQMGYHLIDDIGPYTDWGGVLEDIDTIIYLDARVHVMQETSTDPLDEYRRVNTAGTERLAYMAAKAGVNPASVVL